MYKSNAKSFLLDIMQENFEPFSFELLWSKSLFMALYGMI